MAGSKKELKETMKLINSCSKCLKENNEAKKFKVCSKCKYAQYCSRECQVADWVDHKQACNKVAKSDASRSKLKDFKMMAFHLIACYGTTILAVVKLIVGVEKSKPDSKMSTMRDFSLNFAASVNLSHIEVPLNEYCKFTEEAMKNPGEVIMEPLSSFPEEIQKSITTHGKGKFPFAVINYQGLQIAIPLLEIGAKCDVKVIPTSSRSGL